MTEGVPQNFPHYPSPPPAPQGIPVADPKFHRPLYKLMKLMLQPRTKAFKTLPRQSKRTKRKTVKFY